MKQGNSKIENHLIEPDPFYEELNGEGTGLRDILWPLDILDPRERAIFTEYHYWKTHMKVVSQSHKISLGRAYELLYRAEAKVASTRAQKEKEEPGSYCKGGELRAYMDRV